MKKQSRNPQSIESVNPEAFNRAEYKEITIPKKDRTVWLDPCPVKQPIGANDLVAHMAHVRGVKKQDIVFGALWRLISEVGRPEEHKELNAILQTLGAEKDRIKEKVLEAKNFSD